MIESPIRTAKIGEHVARAETWNPGRDANGKLITYIDLSSIDNAEKSVIGYQSIPRPDAPSRARQLVRAGDILVSTVRPNLNGVARVPDKLDGATASTGFCVLRPANGAIASEYLFHWVRSPLFITDMMRKATGASYPAVSDRIVLDSEIPLPPLDEQRRIAAILDQADALRRKRREAIEQLALMKEAIFVEMFVRNESDAWPTRTIAQVAVNIRTGPFGSQLLHSEFVDEGIAVLGIDNAVNNEFQWDQRRFITSERYRQLRRYTVLPGDVLITLMGTCGRCAIVPIDIPTAINTKHLCCITLDQSLAVPAFVQAAFLQHPAILRQLGLQTKGAVMPGLNMGIVKDLELPIPPLELQLAFARRIEIANEMQLRFRKHGQHLDALFVSLQHRAFRGEL
jgi:type I restriction enzyme S subunit